MKKSALVLVGLMMLAATANANIIGIFTNPEGTLCSGDMITPYTYAYVKFVALLTDVGAITAAEFGATNVNLAGTLPTVTWTTTLVIGDIMTPAGVALAWTNPQPGPIVQLGQIQYFLLAAQPNNVKMCVVPSGAGVLAVVDDQFVTHPASGWCYVVNCVVGGPYGACTCLDNIPTEDASWGAVKSLF